MSAELSQQASAFGISLAVTEHGAGTTEPIFPRASVTLQASDSPFSTRSVSVWMSQCQQTHFLADGPFRMAGVRVSVPVQTTAGSLSPGAMTTAQPARAPVETASSVKKVSASSAAPV